MSRALDYATRSLIAETVRAGMREAALSIDTVPVPQLHGPCNVAVELFVIGAALHGAVSPAIVPLTPADFWSRLHGKVWAAILSCPEPLELAQVASSAVLDQDAFADLDEAVTLLQDWRDLAGHHVALRDVATAVALLAEHSRARRLVRELARLADAICGGSECFDSARDALRHLFTAEAAAKRGEKPPEPRTPPPPTGRARDALKPLPRAGNR